MSGVVRPAGMLDLKVKVSARSDAGGGEISDHEEWVVDDTFDEGTPTPIVGGVIGGNVRLHEQKFDDEATLLFIFLFHCLQNVIYSDCLTLNIV